LSVYLLRFFFVFFFFQAEDGIRDFHVTGVQTCALPIDVQLAVIELLVRQLRDAHARIGRILNAERELSPLDLMRWPGVIGEQEPEQGPLHAAALALLDQALAELRDNRRAEGERIAALISERARAVSEKIGRAH